MGKYLSSSLMKLPLSPDREIRIRKDQDDPGKWYGNNIDSSDSQAGWSLYPESHHRQAYLPEVLQLCPDRDGVK